MMSVRWSPEAADDLERIVDYIKRNNPPAARRVAETIYRRCGDLQVFPERGRQGRIAGTRELVLVPLPYIVVYRVRPDAVEIVRIYHSAQNWP
jgi:toxin ParE1/3/4